MLACPDKFNAICEKDSNNRLVLAAKTKAECECLAKNLQKLVWKTCDDEDVGLTCLQDTYAPAWKRQDVWIVGSGQQFSWDYKRYSQVAAAYLQASFKVPFQVSMKGGVFETGLHSPKCEEVVATINEKGIGSLKFDTPCDGVECGHGGCCKLFKDGFACVSCNPGFGAREQNKMCEDCGIKNAKTFMDSNCWAKNCREGYHSVDNGESCIADTKGSAVFCEPSSRSGLTLTTITQAACEDLAKRIVASMGAAGNSVKLPCSKDTHTYQTELKVFYHKRQDQVFKPYSPNKAGCTTVATFLTTKLKLEVKCIQLVGVSEFALGGPKCAEMAATINDPNGPLSG